MIEFSKRIEGLSEYYFSSKLREVKSLIDSGEDIINLGIGSPDLSPPTPVIKKLKVLDLKDMENLSFTMDLRSMDMNQIMHIYVLKIGISMNGVKFQRFLQPS